MTDKILILTTQLPSVDKYDRGNIASHSLWGMTELRANFNVTIKPVSSGVLYNTINFVEEDFDVLYMHNLNPIRILPIHILKRLFPSIRKKRIICLCHASVFGKGHKSSNWKKVGGVISFLLKGYHTFIFFSPKSMQESIDAGIPAEKCRLCHWGADMSFINSHVDEISDNGYWLSTGKECRDYQTMERAAIEVNKFSQMKIVMRGTKYIDTLRLTAACTGVIVVPNKDGLNYCTGLTCVMEALSLGKPIISVRNPYFPFDIEKEGCGLYVPIESPTEIVNAIHKIESSSELYKSMCSNSLRMSKVYNMGTFEQELLSIIGA